ncbi:DUF2188 domain-containing protein [Microbacterium thalli]|uniref:DUF2188 domain-containing protein n=1 Tax=Microbacterium thalli TaxID=3027921 RepID=A0ABT5SEI1_9MICO|nr:DUF2188 domain-containing protein [Microbacterium thalli]MDD7961116.1 DUF2188 domain-containing protein [Microbacterium thalli]
MPKGDVETFHQDDAWHNRIEGERTLDDAYPTKSEAIAAGRELERERQVEHIIKNENGRIAERNSYGNDPRDVKG